MLSLSALALLFLVGQEQPQTQPESQSQPVPAAARPVLRIRCEQGADCTAVQRADRCLRALTRWAQERAADKIDLHRQREARLACEALLRSEGWEAR